MVHSCPRDIQPHRMLVERTWSRAVDVNSRRRLGDSEHCHLREVLCGGCRSAYCTGRCGGMLHAEEPWLIDRERAVILQTALQNHPRGDNTASHHIRSSSQQAVGVHFGASSLWWAVTPPAAHRLCLRPAASAISLPVSTRDLGRVSNRLRLV